MKRDDKAWLDGWLREWARWMRADKHAIRCMVGMPRRSAGFSTGGGSSVDAFDEMSDGNDIEILRKIDKCVNRLDGQHWSAVQAHYLGVEARHRGDPKAVLAAAIALLVPMVKRENVV